MSKFQPFRQSGQVFIDRINARRKGAGPSQESLTDQLLQLKEAARVLGLYDAEDYFRQIQIQEKGR